MLWHVGVHSPVQLDNIAVQAVPDNRIRGAVP